MADDKVWVSRAMVDSTLIKSFRADVYLADQDRAIDTIKRNDRGELLHRELFPNEMYGKYADKRHKKQPDICNPSGFWTVSAACEEVLRSVDLGRTELYPVKLFQHDRKTPVEGEYFCINFGETKQAFVPEYSPRVKKPFPNEDLWKLRPSVKDDDFAVNSTALIGPDLWVDPLVWNGLFLSDRVVQALKAAKLTRRFGLRRCRVIPNN